MSEIYWVEVNASKCFNFFVGRNEALFTLSYCVYSTDISCTPILYSGTVFQSIKVLF